MSLVHKTSLDHVSALISIEGNERADVLAKASTEYRTTEFELTVHVFHIILKKEFYLPDRIDGTSLTKDAILTHSL